MKWQNLTLSRVTDLWCEDAYDDDFALVADKDCDICNGKGLVDGGYACACVTNNIDVFALTVLINQLPLNEKQQLLDKLQ